MPFITEEIWQSLPHQGSALIVANWPASSDTMAFPEEETHMEAVMQAIRAVRNRRAEMNVPPSKKATLYVVTQKPTAFQEGIPFILRLAYADEVIVMDADPQGYEDMAGAVTADARLYMPMKQLVDVAKELDRIARELEKAQKNLAVIEGKLSNEKFTARAPESVVNAEREKAEKLNALIAQLLESKVRLETMK